MTERKKRNDEKIVFFGHHKCASTWMRQIIGDIAEHTGYDFYENEGDDFENKFHIIANSSSDSLVKYTNFLGIHLIRDPRDIVVSGYHSHKTSHWLVPEWKDLHEVRKKLNEIPLIEGIYIEIDFLRKTFNEMYSWEYNYDNVLELKYEDINEEYFYSKMYDFLKLDKIGLSYGIYEEIIEKNSFSKLSGGREIGKEDRNSHYRKGMSGEWIQYFSPEIKQYFKEQYGDLLIKLGYENDNDW